MSNSVVSPERTRALRRAINALMEIQVLDARERLTTDRKIFTPALDLATLKTIYKDVAGLDLGPDGIVEHARKSPAVIKLERDTGAQLVIGSRYGYSFAGDGNRAYPVLQFQLPS